MARIRVNYDALRTASAAVAKRSAFLKDVCANLGDRADALSATWAGVTEDVWFEQLLSCKTRMDTSHSLLDELARDLNAAAETIEKAENGAMRTIITTIDPGA
jgi:WXG100 family type VII secretion target